MKVTALIPDDLIEAIRKLTYSKNLTESLISALTDWVQHQELVRLTKEVRQKPLRFRSPDVARRVRALNREVR